MNHLQHIAFVLDGNRRWAKEQGKSTSFGHRSGGKTFEAIVKACVTKNIPYVTFWALSTENLKSRSKPELEFLFKLLETELPKHAEEMDKEGIEMRVIGDTKKLPPSSQKVLADIQQKTEHNTKATVVLAINYGGRDEIVRSTRSLVESGVKPTDINEETFSSYLDTKDIPDPDLVIRTGGNKRLSGYLLWQCAYAELYFTDTLWPDFNEAELDQMIGLFQEEKRNFGK